MGEIKPLRRLPLEGTANTRDLGGYPCPGGVTRWQSFLRSDSPSALTTKDMAYLKAYGVTTAVDLRGATEREKAPTALCAAEGFADCHVPMSDHIFDLDYQGDLPGSMSGLYIGMLDGVPGDLMNAMEILADAAGGCLFNCHAGKDRTGVIAMLLLQLAGVGDADIVADYMATEVLMAVKFKGDTTLQHQVPEHVLRSVPESMWRTLRHLHETYGGAEKYLLASGLPAAKVERLKQKLVEPALLP